MQNNVSAVLSCACACNFFFSSLVAKRRERGFVREKQADGQTRQCVDSLASQWAVQMTSVRHELLLVMSEYMPSSSHKKHVSTAHRMHLSITSLFVGYGTSKDGVDGEWMYKGGQ